MLWALLLALACGVGAFAIAQENQSGDRIVRIGPDDGATTTPVLPQPDAIVNGETRQAAPSHWIGIVGGPVTPELRAHVDLPAEQGLLVREIVPNSPAAKSGLKLYDILLRANDTQLREMGDLVELVRAAGQMQGQVTLEVLRKGQRESIAVKPEERPADVAAQVPGGLGEGGFDAGNGIGPFGQIPGLDNIPQLRGLLEGFAGDGLPMEFRQFGPGVIVGQGGGMAGIPNGASISIQKQNDQPAHITVKRGEETWEVIGDDAESLNQLPEELRPFVERMLQGNAANRFNFDGDIIQRVLPQGEPPEVGGRRLRQRLENMERQVQQLLEQSRGTDQPVIDESK